MTTLDYDKLSIVKKQIVRRVYSNGYTTDLTYTREKEWLITKGWLRGRRVNGNIISGQYELTSNGLAAYIWQRKI